MWLASRVRPCDSGSGGEFTTILEPGSGNLAADSEDGLSAASDDSLNSDLLKVEDSIDVVENDNWFVAELFSYSKLGTRSPLSSACSTKDIPVALFQSGDP